MTIKREAKNHYKDLGRSTCLAFIYVGRGTLTEKAERATGKDRWQLTHS